MFFLCRQSLLENYHLLMLLTNNLKVMTSPVRDCLFFLQRNLTAFKGKTSVVSYRDKQQKNQNSHTVTHGPVVVYESLFSYYNGPLGCMVLSLHLVPDGKCH